MRIFRFTVTFVVGVIIISWTYLSLGNNNKSNAFSSIIGSRSSSSSSSLLSSSSSSDYVNLSSFAIHLFAELAVEQDDDDDSTGDDDMDNGKKDNVLVSPYCIASVLALVAAGATPSSTCESQLYSTLGFKHSSMEMTRLREIIMLSSSSSSSSSSPLSSSPDTNGGGVQLTISNSIWTQPEKINPEYISLVENSYDAFANELPSQYEPINDWISDQTNGLLPDVFPSNKDIDPLTVALLVSVVYFHGSWAEQFDPKATSDGIFYTARGQERQAKFMHARRKMEVLESASHLGGASILRLDYGGSSSSTSDNDNNNNNNNNNTDHNHNYHHEDEEKEFCALFILPGQDTKESMTEAILGLTESNDSLVRTLNVLNKKEVQLSLPRFRINWGPFSVKETLIQLGIQSAFSTSNTDQNLFSVMSNDTDVYLDDVIHQVKMEVTEEGTIAAAAAGAIMMTRSLPERPFVLTLDRPFIMIVLHVPTSTPLFMGKFDNPDLTL